MAKYPLIHGNTHSRYDLNDSNGDSLCISDSIFDVYKFQNSGDTDNAERATMVVVLKNLAVPGTDTSLEIEDISLRMPNSSDQYEENGTGSGVDISLNGIPPQSSTPFMGAPEDFSSGSNNKILSKHADVPGDTSSDNAAGVHDNLFCFRIYDPAETVEEDDILTDNDSSETHIAMPIFKTTTLEAQTNQGFGVPTQCYAAFTVHFHPQQDIPSFITICDLYIGTNAGSYTYPLKVNSYNEIVMVAQPGLANFSASQFELDILNTSILDGNFLELGYQPKIQATGNDVGEVSENDAKILLQDLWAYDGIKISDVSPNNIGNGTYKWKDSDMASTLTGDGVTISAPANHSHAPSTQWYNIDKYYTDEGCFFGDDIIALHGTDNTAEYYNVPGRYPIYQYFESLNIYDGTSTSGATGNRNGAHQTEGSWKRYKCFGVKYKAEDYNNTSGAQGQGYADGYDISDAEPTNNQWFLYGIKYGVYQKITFDSAYVGLQTGGAYATRNVITNMTFNYGNGDHAAVLNTDDLSSSGASVNGEVAQTNRTWHFHFPVRWNNWNGSTSQTNENQYAMTSFNWAGGNNYVQFKGTGCDDTRPTSYSEDGGVTYNTGGQFSLFSFGAGDGVTHRDAWFRLPFHFKLEPSQLYSSCRWFGDGSSNKLEAQHNGAGVRTCELKPKDTDEFWNRDGVYPGLDKDADICFKAAFMPRDPFIKISRVAQRWFYKDESGTQGGTSSAGTPGYENGTGLPENINGATNVVSLVSNINPDGYWYGPAGNRIYNTSSQFNTNNGAAENVTGFKMYSGNNGTVYENTNIKETIRTTAAAAVHNADKKYIKDKTENFVKEFIPYNKILQFPAPSKHSSNGTYQSYFSFRPFNEGDYPIWIHSVEVINCENGDGKGQMLDFCNKTFTQTNCSYNGLTIALAGSQNALAAGIRIGMSVSSTTNASNFSSGQYITEINGSVITLNAVPDATVGSGTETCTFEFRTIHGTKRFGYKPSHNGTDTNESHANSSNSGEMRYIMSDNYAGGKMTSWRKSNSYNNPSRSFCPVTSNENQDGDWPHALDVANPAEWYRGHSSGSYMNTSTSPYSGGLYLPPKMCQSLNVAVDMHDAVATDERLDEDNIPNLDIDYWKNYGSDLSGHDYPEFIGADEGFNPEGNPTINLEFKVAAKNTTVDFGSYYATLKIRYYKDTYWGKKRIAYGGAPVPNTNPEHFRIHEVSFICKMDVQPTPVLAIHDTEGHNHTLNNDISMGNINLG